MAAEQGVAQGQVGGLDLPPLVIKPDQRRGRVAAVVSQRGDQPVGVAGAAAVSAGHRHVGLDDPHAQAVQARQVGAVGQVAPGHGDCGWTWRAPAASPRWRAPRRGTRCRVEGPVQQDQHPRAAAGAAAAGPGRPRPGRHAEPTRGAEQAAGAGLGQRHHPQGGIPRKAHPVADPARSRPGCGRCRGPSGSSARRRRQCAARRSDTPGVCGWASGPATTSNRAFSGAGPRRRRRSRRAFSDGDGTSSPASPAVSLPHTRSVAQLREHRQRQHEIHPGPRRQDPQPALHRPGLLQHIIDQLERQVLR